MNYTCPVCGYPDLNHPPTNFNICPCCFIEFGYEDASKSHDALRAEWVAGGCVYHSTVNIKPVDWSAIEQMGRAGFDLRELAKFATKELREEMEKGSAE